MVNIFTLSKSSHLLTDIQKNIIVDSLNNYFQDYLEDSDEYLTDVQNINYKQCDAFANIESAIYGAWLPIYFKSLFIRPGFFNKKYRENYINKGLTDNDTEYNIYKTDLQYYDGDLIQVKNNNIVGLNYLTYNKAWINSVDTYLLLKYLYSSVLSMMISTVCHELYHKYQFTTKPLKYFLNSFIGLFIPYEKQCELSWTTQGQVRVNVDNEQNNKIFKTFEKIFQYIELKSNLYKIEVVLNNEDYKKLINNGTHVIILSIQRQYAEFDKSLLETKEYKFMIELLKKYHVFTEDFYEFLMK